MSAERRETERNGEKRRETKAPRGAVTPFDHFPRFVLRSQEETSFVFYHVRFVGGDGHYYLTYTVNATTTYSFSVFFDDGSGAVHLRKFVRRTALTHVLLSPRFVAE